MHLGFPLVLAIEPTFDYGLLTPEAKRGLGVLAFSFPGAKSSHPLSGFWLTGCVPHQYNPPVEIRQY